MQANNFYHKMIGNYCPKQRFFARTVINPSNIVNDDVFMFFEYIETMGVRTYVYFFLTLILISLTDCICKYYLIYIHTHSCNAVKCSTDYSMAKI